MVISFIDGTFKCTNYKTSFNRLLTVRCSVFAYKSNKIYIEFKNFDITNFYVVEL